MANPLNGPIAGFQDLVQQVPDIVQPLIVALAGAVPFIEGELSAMIGVVGGLNPVVAALAGILGNLGGVVLVVLLSARIRRAAVAGKAKRVAARLAVQSVGVGAPSGLAESVAAGPGVGVGVDGAEIDDEDEVPAKRESKGRQKFNRWVVRFGVPGASILGPLALPTHFTAATLVAAGIGVGRVIFWQAIAIILWTGVTTVSAVVALMVVQSV